MFPVMTIKGIDGLPRRMVSYPHLSTDGTRSFFGVIPIFSKNSVEFIILEEAEISIRLKIIKTSLPLPPNFQNLSEGLKAQFGQSNLIRRSSLDVASALFQLHIERGACKLV